MSHHLLAPGAHEFYENVYGDADGSGGTKILPILNSKANTHKQMLAQARILREEGFTALELLDRDDHTKGGMGTDDLVRIAGEMSAQGSRVIIGTVKTPLQLAKVLDSLSVVGFSSPAEELEFVIQASKLSGGIKLSFVKTLNPSNVHNSVLKGVEAKNGKMTRAEQVPPDAFLTKISPSEEALEANWPLRSHAKNTGSPRSSFVFTSPEMSTVMAREIGKKYGSIEQEMGHNVRIAIALVLEGEDLTKLRELQHAIADGPLESRWKS